MKSNKIIFSILLLTGIFLNFKSPVYADLFFDGGTDRGGNTNVNFNNNIPMPATPSPPPSYDSSDDEDSQSQPTYSTPKKNSSSGSLLTPQMRDDIVDSVYKQWVQQQKQAKLNAIKAQKEAEEKKKQEEAKKKKDAQDWLKEYNAGTAPQINNLDTPIKSFVGDDPVAPKINNGFVVPSPTGTLAPVIPPAKSIVKKQEEASMKPVKNEPDPYALKMNEGQMREMYYGADKEIMQCANGTKECSPDYMKALQMKRLTAEQGLTTHYNYKNVGGNFIKKPN